MVSVLILENQEPGDCATCPLFFRNAGVCSWTMRFDGDCPLQRALRTRPGTMAQVYINYSGFDILAIEPKAWKPKEAEGKP